MYSRLDTIDSITILENPNLNTPFRVMQSKQFMQNVIALSYDYARSLLFYSDIQRGTIDAIYFNDTGHRVIVERMYFNLIYVIELQHLFFIYIFKLQIKDM